MCSRYHDIRKISTLPVMSEMSSSTHSPPPPPPPIFCDLFQRCIVSTIVFTFMMCIRIETFHVSVIVPNAMGFYLVVFAQHGDNKAGVFQFQPVPCVCYIENYGKCCPGCWQTNFPFYLTTILLYNKCARPPNVPASGFGF